jgi:hypothetical protein
MQPPQGYSLLAMVDQLLEKGVLLILKFELQARPNGPLMDDTLARQI